MVTPRLAFARLCWLLVAAAGPRLAAAGEGACTGGREALLWVTVEDGGRALEGAVALNGVRAGATSAVLTVPACPRRLRVTAGQYAWEQEVMLKEGTLTAVKLQATVSQVPVRREAPPPVAQAAERPAPPPGPAAAAPAPAPAPVQALPAAPAARLPPTAEERIPAGMAVVHYRRPDRRYAGWTLYAWEDEADGPGVGLPGTSWKSSLKPSGTDDFGAYWLLPMEHFPDGKVNFIVHRGDEREHCNDRDFFTFKDSRETWVIAGRCFHYERKAEALKAARQGAGGAPTAAAPAAPR